MWISTKVRKGHVAHIVRELTDEERHHVIAAWVETPERVPQQSESWLHEIRNQDLWIVCDCQSNVLDNPYLFPTVQRTGKVGLRRTSAQAHAIDCPFYWAEGTLGAPSTHRPRQPALDALEAYRNVAGRPSEELQLRAFKQLVDLGHLERIWPPQPLAAAFKALREQISQIDGDGLLRSLFWTHDSWIKKGWAQAAISRHDEQSGIFFAVLDELQNVVLMVDGLPSQLCAPAGWEVPLLLLGRVDHGRQTLAFPYALPCCPGTAAPVRSIYARSCATTIVRLMREASRRFPDIALDAYAYIASDSPDFLIRAQSREINIIVVRTGDGEGVTEAKRRASAIGQTADVIMDWRSRGNQSDANRDLARRLFGWLGAVASARGKLARSATA